MGKFVVFEGADGVGKSVQASLAKTFLTTQGYTVRSVKEPGNPSLEFCRDIREMLFKKSYSNQLDAVEQGLLFFIDHYANAGFVEALLPQTDVIIADRWTYSQYAHDSVKKNPQVLSCRLYQEYETRQVQPDLVIYLDADPEIIIARLAARTGKDVSQEQKRALWGDKSEIEVHTELRQSYRNLAKRYQELHQRNQGWPKWGVITQYSHHSPEDVFHQGVEPMLLDLMKSV